MFGLGKMKIKFGAGKEHGLDRASAAEEIKKLKEDDLHFVYHLIVERLKLMAQARSTLMMADFHVGERVRFQGANGLEHVGVITRLNKKTASIRIENGSLWNVYPGFLKKSIAV